MAMCIGVVCFSVWGGCESGVGVAGGNLVVDEKRWRWRVKGSLALAILQFSVSA